MLSSSSRAIIWSVPVLWLIGQQRILRSSLSQINLRNWVTTPIRSGSLRLRRVINLKSRADQGHSEAADTQGQRIPADGNEPNLVRKVYVSYISIPVLSTLHTYFVEYFPDPLTDWVIFVAITATPVSQYPQCPFWCIPSVFASKITELKVVTSFSQEFSGNRL